MTIKPIINQKSKDDGSEEQNQSLGRTNVSNLQVCAIAVLLPPCELTSIDLSSIHRISSRFRVPIEKNGKMWPLRKAERDTFAGPHRRGT